MRRAVVALAFVLVATGTAAAYPQFQLSRDQTCSGCHLSPAGGGLLNENGLATAESISQYGTAPEFFYNKVPLPDWLMFGGDIRDAAGFIRTPENAIDNIPMQAEVYGHATIGHFSLQADVGARPPQYDNESATYVWSREHYVMYQSDEGSSDGLFIRVGRFMPVMGLRLAEHVDYTRVYGGTPLYGETYGAAVEYIQPKYEIHASAYMKDPLIDPVVQQNGGAIYAEYRTSEATSLGVETMLSYSDDDRNYRYGVTAKHYVPSQDLLLMFEGQFVNQVIVAGGAPLEIVATGMASKFLGKAFLLDLALNFYDENVRYDTLDRDALDLNLHWFATSHLELIWQNRVEATVGPTGAWSLLQVHYRL
jgi:hypothetical protein